MNAMAGLLKPPVSLAVEPGVNSLATIFFKIEHESSPSTENVGVWSNRKRTHVLRN
jgi:hypothetical protein